MSLLAPKTLMRLAREGKVPAYTISEDNRWHLRFLISELDMWMRSKVIQRHIQYIRVLRTKGASKCRGCGFRGDALFSISLEVARRFGFPMAGNTARWQARTTQESDWHVRGICNEEGGRKCSESFPVKSGRWRFRRAGTNHNEGTCRSFR